MDYGRVVSAITPLLLTAWGVHVPVKAEPSTKTMVVNVTVQAIYGVRTRRLHFMKRTILIALSFLATAGFASAQIQPVTTDVLGAHLNYGRGCAACHAPHSGVYGNGNAKTTDTTSGNIALWGEDVSSLYGKTITSGQSEHGSVTETLPGSTTAGTPDVAGILMCLSCHDGNYATGA